MSEQNEMSALEIADILRDRYSAIILMATNRKPRSAAEISHKHGIPIVACYRRINALLKYGFLTKGERVLTQRGKRMWRYVSNVNKVYVFFEEGKLRARCELKNGYVKIDKGGDCLGRIER